jgi:phenylacetate-CoA ligase
VTRSFFNRAVECLPLAEIIGLQRQNLVKADIIRHACDSALYKECWQQAGIGLKAISNRTELTQFPYINSASIRQAYARYSIAEIVNMENTRLWASTSGSTGEAKWIPYSDSDLEIFEQALMRDLYQQRGKVQAHCVLSFTSPAPFVGDMLTNLAMIAHTRLNLHQEMISVGLSEVESAVNLARQRRVDVLIAFPSVAMKLADEIRLHLKHEVERQWRETKNPKWYLASLYFKIKKPLVRDVFNLRYGLFSGESIHPYRKALRRDYGFEPYETYALTEFPCLNMDCEQHDGIHIWSDCCVPELIPQYELEKEESIPGYIPKAIFLDEAAASTLGEYVITTFSRALPLVRYRTSDVMQIVSTERCPCGRTHPRIRVLHRLDDIINMGLIRFSVQELENAMAHVDRHGVVHQWQIILERRGYKPSPRLIIEAADMTNADAMVEEVKECLGRIEILQKGIDTGLVLPPDIVLSPEIEIVTTATGKLRRVIYAANW